MFVTAKTQRPLAVVHRQMHLYQEPCQTAGQLTSLLLVCEGKTSQCGFGSMPENTTRFEARMSLRYPHA